MMGDDINIENGNSMMCGRCLDGHNCRPKRSRLHTLEEATPEGQCLRLKMLESAVVIVVAAGYPGKRFVFEKAKALGVVTILIDNPGSW
eukprot:1195515-Prorocentrum_minimum.AAC.20